MRNVVRSGTRTSRYDIVCAVDAWDSLAAGIRRWSVHGAIFGKTHRWWCAAEQCNEAPNLRELSMALMYQSASPRIQTFVGLMDVEVWVVLGMYALGTFPHALVTSRSQRTEASIQLIALKVAITKQWWSGAENAAWGTARITVQIMHNVTSPMDSDAITAFDSVALAQIDASICVASYCTRV